jgi:hypothetical protein
MKNIGMKYLIITRSIIFIIIEFCKCDWTIILPLVGDANDKPTLCKNPFKSIQVLGEAHLHDDLDAKETLNHVLWKNYTNNPTTYPQTLKDFALEEIYIFSTLVYD